MGVLNNLIMATIYQCIQFSSVHFSRSVVSNSLWPHELQQARLPYPSPTSRACSNSCPSSQWCHPTISFSVIPFSSCLQSFPASESFFQWVISSHHMTKVLELQLQHQSFQWIFRTDFFRMDWLDLLKNESLLFKSSYLIDLSCCWFCSSITQSCPTLCNPMDCSLPGFSVHHHLPEFAQIHVHWVADAI